MIMEKRNNNRVRMKMKVEMAIIQMIIIMGIADIQRITGMELWEETQLKNSYFKEKCHLFIWEVEEEKI
jgi:hypothetical protein